MQGPVWAQVAVFFAVAIPTILILTNAISWFFARFLTKPDTLRKLYPNEHAFLEDLLYTPLDDVLARCGGKLPMRFVCADVRQFRMGRPYRRKNTGQLIFFKGNRDGAWGLFRDLSGYFSVHAYADLTNALPRIGETWQTEDCERHGLRSGIALVTKALEWYLDEEREEEVRCGCLTPVSNAHNSKE